MIFGRVKASARKMTSGCARRRSAMTHSQNANGFVCGLSTRKIRDAVRDPELDTSRQLVPERCQSSRLEVERIDVLVLLRRVLGVLDRAVGPVPEPLGMLAHLRVIGRGLEGEVERDLEAVPLASATKASKSSSVPRPGSTAVWPPASEPIAHGLPGSSGAGVERVVASLAEAAADRMDRRQVQRRRSPSRRRRAAAPAASPNVRAARRDRCRPIAGTSRTRRRRARARDRPYRAASGGTRRLGSGRRATPSAHRRGGRAATRGASPPTRPPAPPPSVERTRVGARRRAGAASRTIARLRAARSRRPGPPRPSVDSSPRHVANRSTQPSTVYS